MWDRSRAEFERKPAKARAAFDVRVLGELTHSAPLLPGVTTHPAGVQTATGRHTPTKVDRCGARVSFAKSRESAVALFIQFVSFPLLWWYENPIRGFLQGLIGVTNYFLRSV